MRKLTVLLVSLLVLGGALACCVTPQIPDININVPTLEVGEMEEERHAIPLAGTESAMVELVFGAGKLDLEAGTSDQLFVGDFRYNVKRWAPEVSYEGGELSIKQGGSERNWGLPTGNIRNTWELEFSPEVPLAIDAKLGAGEGELDFTGLRLTAVDLDMGAGDFNVRFDEPNEVTMDHLTMDTGASKLEVHQIGNAGLREMRLQGGVGDIRLDFTGAWARSADIKITAGAGALNLRLPESVGVEIETKGGLSNVEAFGLRQMGNIYTNDAFGETEVELHISVTTGVGNVRLVEVSGE